MDVEEDAPWWVVASVGSGASGVACAAPVGVAAGAASERVGGLAMNARVKTMFVLMSVAVFLGFSMEGPDNPQGWPAWVGLVGLALVVQAARMAVVELRDPWQGW